jgi:hypothetical protein
MKKMIFLVIAFLSSAVYAQDIKLQPAEALWKGELARELVTVKDGVMSMDEGGVLAVNTVEKTELRVRIKSESPVKGVVSRDNFVAITTALYNSIFIGVASGLLPELPASKIGQVFDFRNDPKSKSAADITIAISIDAKGILIQVSNSRNSNVQKYPIAWEQYFSSLAAAEAEKTQGTEVKPSPAKEPLPANKD